MLDPELRAQAEELSRRGEGPFLAFDLCRVGERVDVLSRLGASHGARFLFAVKAFPDPRVLSFFAERGVGFDLSNVREWEAVREACGSPPADASFTGPCLEELVDRPGFPDELGPALVNLDSREQARRLAGAPLGGLRLGARVGLDPSTRFGYSLDDREALREIGGHPRFRGLHCHVYGDGAGTFLRNAEALAGLAEDLGLPVRYLNLGGGLADLDTEAAVALVGEIRARVPEHVELRFEPGAWWFEGAGFAFTRVTAVVPSRAGRPARVLVDLSRDCHLRWSSPRLLLDPEGEGSEVLVIGPTCHEGDLLGTFRVPRLVDGGPAVARGDVLVFAGVSGYSAAWNTAFNGVEKARVLL